MALHCSSDTQPCLQEEGIQLITVRASLGAQMVKDPPTMQETWARSLGREDPLEEAWQPTPVFLPGESHGQRSPVGHSPWGLKESDMTDQLIHTHHVIFTPEFRLKEVLLHGKFQLRFRRIERGQSQRTALEPSCWEVAWVSQREVHGPA